MIPLRLRACSTASRRSAIYSGSIQEDRRQETNIQTKGAGTHPLAGRASRLACLARNAVTLRVVPPTGGGSTRARSFPFLIEELRREQPNQQLLAP
jgi:hypothetical protein